MKTIQSISLLALGVLVITSCNNDIPKVLTPTPGVVAAQFNAIVGTPNVKTTTIDQNTYWLDTDTIGICMLNAGTTTITSGGDNVPYLAKPENMNERSATFNPTDATIYYPVDSTQKVNFVAYYPWNASVSTTRDYPIDLSDQSASDFESVNDLLYADAKGGTDAAVSYDKTSDPVNFQFRHVLSKMVLQIAAGDGLEADSLKGMTVEIVGLNAVGSFSVETEALSVSTAGTIQVNTSTDGLLAQAILAPQSNTITAINFTLANGNTYTWKPANTQFDAAHQYIYSITISRVGITVDSGTIEDWTVTTDTNNHIIT